MRLYFCIKIDSKINIFSNHVSHTGDPVFIVESRTFSQEPVLGGLVGDRWIHSLCPRLLAETTSTGAYGHYLSGKRL